MREHVSTVPMAFMLALSMVAAVPGEQVNGPPDERPARDGLAEMPPADPVRSRAIAGAPGMTGASHGGQLAQSCFGNYWRRC